MTYRTHRIAAVVAIASLGLCAGFDCAAESAEPAAKTKKQIARFTADALVSLKRSADFLAGQKSYSFGADLSYDVLQPNGQLLEFGGTRDVLMRRPDRLRVEAVDRDGDVMQLFFDGQSILVDMPAEDAYVKVAKPGTLYAALDYLVEGLHTPSPLEEFVSENYAAKVERRIESGFYVGQVAFGDRICEQLAFRTDEIDLQLWIQSGDEPVPCRMVITYKQAEGHPQFTAQFRDWDLSPEVDDEMFAFTPPGSAERIQVQALARELREQREGK